METSSFKEKTLFQFLEQLGSKAPTPGGGGAAALTGANAAGLVTMVARLTVGKEAFSQHALRLQEITDKGDTLRLELLEGIDRDAEAFGALMKSYKLPKVTPEEKEARTLQIQQALLIATESPLNIARNCASLAIMAAELVEMGNPLTISDAGTAAVLAEAALLGALFQARINLKSLKDRNYAEKVTAEIAGLETRALEAKNRAINGTLAMLD